MDRKKREKRIKSLEKTREKHLEKIKTYEGKNYALREYWEREVERMVKEIKEEKEKLEN